MMEKSVRAGIQELYFGLDSASNFLCDFRKVPPPPTQFPYLDTKDLCYLAFRVLASSKVKDYMSKYQGLSLALTEKKKKCTFLGVCLLQVGQHYYLI